MPFTTPVIDDFLRTESPLSDSGQWSQPMHGGSSDYMACGNIGSGYTLGDVGHHPGGTGHGFCLRVSNPGASYDQELAMYCSGIMGIAHRLLRFDLAGNGYWGTAGDDGSGNTSFKIFKSVSYATTLLGSHTLAVSPENMIVGMRAIGTEISLWYSDSVHGYIQQVAVTDTTYTYGLLGFGGEGGFAGVFPQLQVSGGKIAGSRTTQEHAFTAPILVPFSNTFAH